ACAPAPPKPVLSLLKCLTGREHARSIVGVSLPPIIPHGHLGSAQILISQIDTDFRVHDRLRVRPAQSPSAAPRPSSAWSLSCTPSAAGRFSPLQSHCRARSRNPLSP